MANASVDQNVPPFKNHCHLNIILLRLALGIPHVSSTNGLRQSRLHHTSSYRPKYIYVTYMSHIKMDNMVVNTAHISPPNYAMLELQKIAF